MSTGSLTPRRNRSRDSFEDDDMEDSRPLVADNQTSEAANDIPMCGCMSIKYYQPFFDVDTTDVIGRIKASLFFCRAGDNNFMSLVEQKPDAYGPFWISTTLVFVAAVTSHFSSWVSAWLNGTIWVYDFEEILSISSVIYGFSGGVPLTIWFILRQMGATMRLITAVCLYGYSLTIFVPAAIICVAPSETVHWLALTAAAALSSLFLVRNLAPTVVQHVRQHAAIFLGGVALTQMILVLILKLCFFYRD